jgi:hypothetical protein
LIRLLRELADSSSSGGPAGAPLALDVFGNEFGSDVEARLRDAVTSLAGVVDVSFTAPVTK